MSLASTSATPKTSIYRHVRCQPRVNRGVRTRAAPTDVDKVLRTIDADHRDACKRAIERAARAVDRWGVEASDFVDPGTMASIERAVSAAIGDECRVIAYGGYESCERKRAIFARAESIDMEAIQASVRVLRVEGNFMFDPAKHGDFLGAILGTGIVRGKVGDILLRGERGADVLCSPEMCEFLSEALTSVRTVKVTASEVDMSELKVPAPKVEEIQTFEASTRLDAVASAGFRMSRSKFGAFITSGDVKVNWKEVSKGNVELSVNDVISCRGKGRVEVKEINAAKKEGRFAIRLVRYV